MCQDDILMCNPLTTVSVSTNLSSQLHRSMHDRYDPVAWILRILRQIQSSVQLPSFPWPLSPYTAHTSWARHLHMIYHDWLPKSVFVQILPVHLEPLIYLTT